MGADHTGLHLDIEVCWLTCGHVLKRVVELQEEITTFLRIRNKCPQRKSSVGKVCGKRHIRNEYDVFPQLKTHLPERNVDVQGIVFAHFQQFT